MATQKNVPPSSEDAADSVVAPAEQSESSTLSAPLYRDNAYTSRTLILPSGAAVPVMAGKINADSDELLAFLESDADFERLQE